MHCPRCGQLQASQDIKFCSRCGFPMGTVAEVLAHGGHLPQLEELYQQSSKTWLTRKNGVVFSVMWFFFFVLILTPMGGILDVDVLAGFSAIVGIFGGLMLLILSLVMLQPANSRPRQFAHQQPPPQPGIAGNSGRNALPSQQSRPADVYTSPQGAWQSPETGDLAQPGSVTEGTTKLLKKEEER